MNDSNNLDSISPEELSSLASLSSSQSDFLDAVKHRYSELDLDDATVEALTSHLDQTMADYIQQGYFPGVARPNLDGSMDFRAFEFSEIGNIDSSQ